MCFIHLLLLQKIISQSFCYKPISYLADCDVKIANFFCYLWIIIAKY